MLFMLIARWLHRLDYKSRISYCAPCLGERYSVSRVSREKLYERLTACANRYLSFEAEFLMRTFCASMHNCMETKSDQI